MVSASRLTESGLPCTRHDTIFTLAGRPAVSVRSEIDLETKLMSRLQDDVRALVRRRYGQRQWRIHGCAIGTTPPLAGVDLAYTQQKICKIVTKNIHQTYTLPLQCLRHLSSQFSHIRRSTCSLHPIPNTSGPATGRLTILFYFTSLSKIHGVNQPVDESLYYCLLPKH